MAKNDGSIFEEMLEYTHQIYKMRRIAVIEKRATSVKVFKSRGNRVLDGVYEKKAIVDYGGPFKAKALEFDAKSVLKGDEFPLSYLADHQYEHLELCHETGALCFLLIFFIQRQKVFLLEFEQLREFKLKTAKRGIKKAITIAQLQEFGHPLRIGSGGVPVHYLPAVEKVWFNQSV